MALDDDLPAEDDSSADPIDADGNLVTDDDTNGPIDVPIQGGPDDDDSGIEMQDDGSAIVTLDAKVAVKKTSQEFFENLAEDILDEGTMQRRAIALIESIERDREARTDRDKQYAEGIKRTGLGGEAPGGADFEGASRVVHPVLAEGCVDFAARAMKEICPAQGPCKTQIIGKSTPEKIDKAERKRQYMNWQLTHQIEDYRDQTKRMLTQLPLGGSQYKHWWWDPEHKRACNEFVPIDDVIIPSGAQSFYSAQRITLQQDITEQMYARRVDSGYYRDVDSLYSSVLPEESAAGAASQKVEGVAPDPYNQDGLRRVLVINSAFESFDEDPLREGDPAPYMWHIDETTRKVLAVYRNWEPDDENFERMHWLIDYTFIHWRGAQGIGLLHLIGSLSGAITGSIRSILDNALAQNAMSGLKLKGGKVSGTTESPNVGEVTELEGPTGGSVDDIRKLYMPFPFNPTSPVLFQITEWLVGEARGVVQVASEKLADGKTDMPVGSTLALIEEGSHVFSDIHSGLHHSQGRELKVLHRLNSWHLSDKETVKELGDLIVSSEDFQGPCDIIPVSDPRIFSEVQRYAQMQAVQQLAANPVFAPKAKPDGILRRSLDLLHIQDPEDLFAFTPEPEDLDPVSENMMVALGEQPIKAFSFQDHMAHLTVHLHFITSPMFGQNPMIGMKFVPQLMQHCFEHMVYEYSNHCVAAAHVASALGKESQTSDGQFALVLPSVDQFFSQELNQLWQMFQAAMKLAQQYMQQLHAPPPDPQAQATLQVGMAEIQRKSKDDQNRFQLDQQKFKSEQAEAQTKMQVDQARLQQQEQADHDREQTKLMIDHMTQVSKDAREQDRLIFDERSKQADLLNQQILAEIKNGYQLQTAQFEKVFDAIIMKLTPQDPAPAPATPSTPAAPDSMKEGGSVTPKSDPVHTELLQKIHESLVNLPAAQSDAVEKSGGQQRAALMALVQALQTSHGELSTRLEGGLSTIAHLLGNQPQGAQAPDHSEKLAQAVEQMRELTQNLHGETSQQNKSVQQALSKLHKAVLAPRVRELRKDKKGNKIAVDRPAKEGET